jgi:hypothetical protein
MTPEALVANGIATDDIAGERGAGSPIGTKQARSGCPGMIGKTPRPALAKLTGGNFDRDAGGGRPLPHRPFSAAARSFATERTPLRAACLRTRGVAVECALR